MTIIYLGKCSSITFIHITKFWCPEILRYTKYTANSYILQFCKIEKINHSEYMCGHKKFNHICSSLMKMASAVLNILLVNKSTQISTMWSCVLSNTVCPWWYCAHCEDPWCLLPQQLTAHFPGVWLSWWKLSLVDMKLVQSCPRDVQCWTCTNWKLMVIIQSYTQLHTHLATTKK